jgi:hypothetical protein
VRIRHFKYSKASGLHASPSSRAFGSLFSGNTAGQNVAIGRASHLANVASGRSSFSANHVGVFRGFVSAYSQNEVNGTKQRFWILSQPQQCALFVLRMLVIGAPPNWVAPAYPNGTLKAHAHRPVHYVTRT